MTRIRLIVPIACLVSLAASCAVKERCFQPSDCPAPKVCGAAGTCVWVCSTDPDCGDGFACEAHVCRPKGTTVPLACPADMTAVAGVFCIDRYEASRPDATADAEGTSTALATSRAGVLPWTEKDNAAAEAACVAAGKRLCTPPEWETACRGPDGHVYSYGDTYDPAACNGIDAFGRDAFHRVATGSFARCVNGWGAWDMNGNLWEQVRGGTLQTVRGGAYNCSDSLTFHRCDYIPGTWAPVAIGFRCCRGAATGPSDPAPEAAGDLPAVPDGLPDAPGETADVPSPDPGVPPEPEEVCGPPDPAPADAADAADPAADAADAADDADPAADDADAPADAPPPPVCPDDMVPLPPAGGATSCIDRWEASRSDATGTDAGLSTTATSRPGVLPWWGPSLARADADAGCAAAGKRLCRLDEWLPACHGPAGTVYAYGDTYDPAICNGIDAFPGAYHVAPTGSFPDCRDAWGVLDLNGNVWELVDHGDGLAHYHGGAYNCGDSATFHRCDFEPTWDVPAKGFRCCRDAP